MAQYIAFRPGIEVQGRPVQGMFDAAGGRFAPLFTKILNKLGLDKFEPTDWLPLEIWLDVLREIATSIGERTLFAMAKRIPEMAEWPPGIDSVEAALASINVAYHLNHRIDGEVMFDPATGMMKEGIGHYRCKVEGDRRIVIVCETPYPSEYDRGIISGSARRFRPAAEVTLDETKPTRKRGADSCTYLVRW